MKTSITPEQILVQQSALARHQRARNTLQNSHITLARTQYAAQIIDFNADSGLYRCLFPDGSIVFARSITPVAGKGIGDMVSLSKNQGTNIIRYL